MTALAAFLHAELLTLTLRVSADQTTWYQVSFEGESPAFIDNQAADYLRQRPYLSAELDEESACYELFPETFDAVFFAAPADQKLVQLQLATL